MFSLRDSISASPKKTEVTTYGQLIMSPLKLMWTVTVIIQLICSKFAIADITCRDQSGKPVDWFAVYKLPKIKSSADHWTVQGLGSLYLDVNSPQWTLNTLSIGDPKHAVGWTLNQIYHNNQSKDVAYGLYNDETPPKHVSYSHGHTKGDFAFDAKGGFWLVHSVPRFPPYSNTSYSYPHSGLNYGQTFLCISLDYKYLDLIGKQFLYTWPQFYDYNLPESFRGKNPNIANALNNHHVKTGYNLQPLISQGQQSFSSFAKYSDFDADLYDSWIAPHYKNNLMVESWLNGVGALGSNCSATYKVLNIGRIDASLSQIDMDFSHTKDHSKWAVTNSSRILCIGDINREESQKRRAGGTVCFEHPKAWQSFYSIVNGTNRCGI